jgi:hypothetical protein
VCVLCGYFHSLCIEYLSCQSSINPNLNPNLVFSWHPIPNCCFLVDSVQSASSSWISNTLIINLCCYIVLVVESACNSCMATPWITNGSFINFNQLVKLIPSSVPTWYQTSPDLINQICSWQLHCAKRCTSNFIWLYMFVLSFKSCTSSASVISIQIVVATIAVS